MLTKGFLSRKTIFIALFLVFKYEIHSNLCNLLKIYFEVYHSNTIFIE